MVKNKIALVTLHNNTLRDMMKQCYELNLMEDFDIQGRTVDQLADLPITESSLIIASCDGVVPEIKAYCVRNVPVIVAKRSINFANIRGVLDLPRGLKVLLVNDSLTRAVETIQLLQDLGIDLDFYPYYPGISSYPEDVAVAVTPGEHDLAPATASKVIDIGSRIIDIATWIEVSAYFHYQSPKLNDLAEKYIYSIVYITQQLSWQIQKTQLLHKQLEVIVNRIEDGVLVIDEHNIIRIANEKASLILGLKNKEMVDKPVKECITDQFYRLIEQLPLQKEEVLKWENQSFFFRKTYVVIEGKNYGFLIIFRHVSEINELEYDYRRKQMSKGLVAKYTFQDLIGTSQAFRKLCQIAQKMAKGNSTILLLGETGTGKELLAQAIHNVSLRCREAFVGVNFAAISESLLESELFGYEDGAFTGARKGGRIGLFEQAHKGTIFLDEIGDASSVIQNRLLRVIQERELMRVGGNRIIPVDIRVIAATNRNLKEMAQNGLFRSDLYYRLNVLPIYVPPLRERKEDILILSQSFVRKFCTQLQRPFFHFSTEALRIMKEYAWPGNIRELENVIEYLAYVVEDIVSPQQLSFYQEPTSMPAEQTVAAKRFELAYQSYVTRGFIDEIQMILQIFQQAQHAVGRNYITARLKTQTEREMTEQQLRYRLQLLKHAQLIQVGKGRQGSLITQQGFDFLQYIQARQKNG
jgi:Transcriptional regulator containing PAS, AAA-type ATPase, and DNA-binding domains